MVNSIELGGYLVVFPVWVIANKSGKLDDILTARHPDGEIAKAVFTDEDSARTFLESSGCPVPEQYECRPLGDALALLGFAWILGTGGYTHILFDASGTKGNAISLDGIICDITKCYQS